MCLPSPLYPGSDITRILAASIGFCISIMPFLVLKLLGSTTPRKLSKNVASLL